MRHDRGQRELRQQLTDDPEVRSTESDRPGHVPGGRLWSAGPGGVVLHRHRLARPGRARRAVPHEGSRVVVVGGLQQRAWTAEDGSARSVVEVVAEELGPSLRWATATPSRATRSS
jgi:hypothetical protein